MRLLPFLLLFIIAFAASCKKDITEEPVQTLAKYTLVTEGANCSNSSVHGNYTVGIPVSGDNYISLDVDVTAICRKFLFNLHKYRYASNPKRHSIPKIK